MDEKSLKPQLRFKGFTEAWEQRKFKSTIQIERGGSPRPIEDYITNSENALNWIKIGDAPSMGKYITKTAEKIKPEGLSKTREVHPGDLILSNSMSFGRPYIMAINGCIHDGWLLLRNDKNLYDLQFLCHLLGSENMLHQYKSFAAGSTVNNLNKDLVGNTTVSFPKKTEQSKLGAFFDSLDNLITLHQRKLDKLSNVKKALLEKMFPKNDSDVPEIRFKGFTEAWEQRKFKSTIQIERGGSPRPIEDYITNSENALNWIKIGDAPSMGKYITKTAEKIKPEGLSKTREVHPGDLILSNSMSFGRPYIMAINGCIHDGWLLLRNDKNLYDLQFLCHLLGSENMLHQYKSFAAGSTVNNLNKDLVGNTTVSFPKKTEQSKLGAFFDSLDNLITLHQRKLEKLKNIKKACLEKMFV